MSYEAIQDKRFIEHGFGFARRKCWRVCFREGVHSFLSSRSYATQQSAKNAAKRLNQKLNKDPLSNV